MPVQKDPSGRRWVQVEIEVPGSPEEVWQAIATGPGVTSWFVPTRFEEGEGGGPSRVVSSFGPGMDSEATVTEWQPPQRFVAESRDAGPDMPPVATEWVVEARSGGTCVVRVVHSWFMSTDDWDGQFEQAEFGWAVFFQILKLVLTHFRGQPCAAFQLMGVSSEPVVETWTAFTEGLGLVGVSEGQRVSTTAGAPRLAGWAELVGPTEHPGQLLRLDEPHPGLAHLFALPMGGQVFLSVRLFLFGEGAPAAAAQSEPAWQAWLGEHFPFPAPPTSVDAPADAANVA
jgi:uncharacterized protein YndB with AHSA1/START domain